MNDLIAKLERAYGPSDELDYAIGKATGFDFEEKLGGAIRIIGPRYSASIDAAMTLVKVGGDDGFCLRVLTSDNGVAHLAEVWRDDDEHHGRGATPAIALCIAAIRARSQGGE